MVIYHKSGILEFHTLLGDILPTLHGYHIPLTWMITDLECYSSLEVLQADEPIIISGDELDALIQTWPKVQLIWGVLSGFRLPPEEINLSILPKADDSEVWEPNYQIQHPQAECELVAWDGSATFFRSKNQEALRLFTRNFPAAQTLENFDRDQS
jgi:hypothetical protein